MDLENERPSLTPTAPYRFPGVQGSLIIIDLDRFEEIVSERGWNRYKPNPATGLLTRLVEDFARKWSAVVIYGLDYERGTEEVVLEIPGVCPWELEDDLVDIAKHVEAVDVTVTIVAVCTDVTGIPARNRREAYSSYRREAQRMLERLKRRGGGVVYIDGKIVYRASVRRS
ncbi:MAG: hypothetical protein GSR72_06280 [Desulfurococcales archaeon]|nr:hypothetical protein [Desulfurococcales archaeon]